MMPLDADRLAEFRAFNSDDYCKLYPDIAKAIGEKKVKDPWEHYDRRGRAEGRVPLYLDEVFYRRSYPLAVQEIAAGLAGSAVDHFIRFGRARGYLPNPKAERPANGAVSASPFGGLWIDDADAYDRIRGRLESGQITAAQAERLEFFTRNGYVILSQAIDESLIEGARAVIDRAFAGDYKTMKFECHPVSLQPAFWHPDMQVHPAKALDIHHFSLAIRRLMFAPAIADFLGLIFENKVMASQTLGFLRGSAQDSHQDSAYVVFSLPRKFAASWVALEDVTVGAGELFYYPGSHRLPDFIYGGRFKSVSEARRGGGSRDAVHAEARRHVQSLEPQAERFGLTKQVFAAKKGDVLIWHSDLIHGGNPVSREITRKSLVTHYCPKHVSPLFNEQHRAAWYEHDGHVHTTSHYPGLEPSD